LGGVVSKGRQLVMFRRRQLRPGSLIRQGDVLLIPVAAAPPSASPLEGVGPGGRLVLLEGEATGHAHTVSAEGATLISDVEAEELYLRVYGSGGTMLEHEEHASLHVPAGTYEVRRQREWTPERGSTWVLD
jgi:hypothetical protein